MTLSPFDAILENRVGFGKYQYITYFFASLTHFSDGSEIVGLSILLPVLKNEWKISDDDQSILGSVLFFGILVGSILGGYVSDKLGRRTALLYSSIIQFVIGVLSTLVHSVSVFILMRGLFGLIIGFTLPLAPSFASELTPVNIRGRGVVFVNFFFSIGSFYAVIVGKFCLDSLNSGNWKAMLIWCSLPSLVVWIGTLIFIKESPRFLIATNRIQEGVDVLNYMSSVNNADSHQAISDSEIEELQNWQRDLFSEAQDVNIKALIEPKHKRTTILLSLMWFTLNFAFYGMTFILPFILAKLETSQQGGPQGLDGILYTIAGEVPSVLIGIYIIEKESFGRKGTTFYSALITVFLFIIASFSSVSMLIALLTIGRMFLKLSFSIMYPMTTEFYPTTIRTVGLGFTSGIGRLGSSIMPIILIELLDIDVMLPILSFGLIMSLHVFAAYMLPFDTRGKPLDLIEEDENQKNNNTYIALKDL